ncbi:ABC transporter ATP-binding protein [uncultured Ruminococcus sp.]|uniref:ABC transporter ATP-binding protein n=1 Tax=uncultured Ruminococcus sp. TaxID=165186 RepID=UPI000EBE3AB3|nr:ABC transporter ATP-binding protein [uncultured Ruminococcus sp.]HCJ40259.1 multidrug ABC transporter permease [Ruminococcus sp.]
MGKDKNGSFGWLLSQAGERKGKFVLSVILAAVSTLCGIAPYYFIARIVKALLAGSTDKGAYITDCVIILALWLGRSFFHALSTANSHLATFHTLAVIRKKALDKLAKMPLGDVISQPSGALKSTIVERVDSIETTLAHILPEFTTGIGAPVIILIYVFTISRKLGLAALITVPLGLVCYALMMFGYEENYGRTVRATKALNAVTTEYINGIEVIKVFGKAQSSYEKFAAAAKESAASFVDWMRKCNVYMTFAMCIMPATMLTVLPIGGIMAMRGTISNTDFITVIILTVGLIEPLIGVMSYSDDIAQMDTIVTEVRNIIDAPEMVRPEKLTKTIRGGDIVLDNVHFSYSDKEILHGISMTIHEGEFAALVGPSGSGKSTVARLIASLWDVDSGSVSLGGVNIKDIPIDEYNDRVAYVSQENYLFDLTVRDNIRLGNRSASDREVEEAAKKCGCHDFIMGLENGYDTVVGSSGGHLSGGERQRISIARAMLKNADIIILDEATAYTDPENEAVIQRSVAKLVKGKTLIVIAHRLSTVKNADRLYVIKDGNIAEQGTHDELLSKGGLYSSMWAAHISAKDGEDDV